MLPETVCVLCVQWSMELWNPNDLEVIWLSASVNTAWASIIFGQLSEHLHWGNFSWFVVFVRQHFLRTQNPFKFTDYKSRNENASCNLHSWCWSVRLRFDRVRIPLISSMHSKNCWLAYTCLKKYLWLVARQHPWWKFDTCWEIIFFFKTSGPSMTSSSTGFWLSSCSWFISSSVC